RWNLPTAPPKAAPLISSWLSLSIFKYRRPNWRDGPRRLMRRCTQARHATLKPRRAVQPADTQNAVDYAGNEPAGQGRRGPRPARHPARRFSKRGLANYGRKAHPKRWLIWVIPEVCGINRHQIVLVQPDSVGAKSGRIIA